MKWLNLKWALPVAVLLLVCASHASAAPLYTECPAIGLNTGCAVLITINANGSVSTAIDSTQGPYDGSEDTLVGVLNNSSSAVTSLNISGSDIFGFDGDGICTYAPFTGSSYCSAAQKSGTDPSDYQGPTSTFTVTNANTGSVNFSGGGVAGGGGSTFFSLEEPPTASLTVTVNSTPEPGTFMLLGSSLLGLAGLFRRKLLA